MDRASIIEGKRERRGARERENETGKRDKERSLYVLFACRNRPLCTAYCNPSVQNAIFHPPLVGLVNSPEIFFFIETKETN